MAMAGYIDFGCLSSSKTGSWKFHNPIPSFHPIISKIIPYFTLNYETSSACPWPTGPKHSL